MKIKVKEKFVDSISGKKIYANKAENTTNGLNIDDSISSLSSTIKTKQDKLTFAGENNTITAINTSAFGVDLSNYYTKSETSGKNEIANALTAKQNVIQSKKNSSLPYLEASNGEPSWEVIENEQINAHGTAQEGEVYNTTINGRTYTMVCLNGKLWLAENYVDDSHALYTDDDYGSYFMANTISQYIPQGWHLPSKEEWESLQNVHSDELEKLFSTDWHTDPNRSEYIQCTNELKLNLTPGGYYNSYKREVLQKGYNSYYATSTYEVLSQSSQQQRVFVELKNFVVSSKSQMISFNWDGPKKADSSYPGNIRLIKDDLDVSGPDCWKTFKGKNFMAIADNEGNTFKDFYLKKAEAQTTYQPIGNYASSAGVETLNTYYALTTTGWKDIAEGFYDKTSINNSLSLKQDKLTFGYDSSNAISSINNSAIAAGGGGGGSWEDITDQCTRAGGQNWKLDRSIIEVNRNRKILRYTISLYEVIYGNMYEELLVPDDIIFTALTQVGFSYGFYDTTMYTDRKAYVYGYGNQNKFIIKAETPGGADAMNNVIINGVITFQ